MLSGVSSSAARRDKIVLLYDKGQGMTIRELSVRFGVSYWTIRNELLAAANEGLLPGRKKRNWRTAGQTIKKCVVTAVLLGALSQCTSVSVPLNWWHNLLDRIQNALST